MAITTFYKMVPRFFVLEIDLALDGMVIDEDLLQTTIFMQCCSKLIDVSIIKQVHL